MRELYAVFDEASRDCRLSDPGVASAILHTIMLSLKKTFRPNEDGIIYLWDYNTAITGEAWVASEPRGFRIHVITVIRNPHRTTLCPGGKGAHTLLLCIVPFSRYATKLMVGFAVIERCRACCRWLISKEDEAVALGTSKSDGRERGPRGQQVTRTASSSWSLATFEGRSGGVSPRM
jgi:hypothetical protein